MNIAEKIITDLLSKERAISEAHKEFDHTINHTYVPHSAMNSRMRGSYEFDELYSRRRRLTEEMAKIVWDYIIADLEAFVCPFSNETGLHDSIHYREIGADYIVFDTIINERTGKPYTKWYLRKLFKKLSVAGERYSPYVSIRDNGNEAVLQAGQGWYIRFTAKEIPYITEITTDYKTIVLL